MLPRSHYSTTDGKLPQYLTNYTHPQSRSREWKWTGIQNELFGEAILQFCSENDLRVFLGVRGQLRITSPQLPRGTWLVEATIFAPYKIHLHPRGSHVLISTLNGVLWYWNLSHRSSSPMHVRIPPLGTDDLWITETVLWGKETCLSSRENSLSKNTTSTTISIIIGMRDGGLLRGLDITSISTNSVASYRWNKKTLQVFNSQHSSLMPHRRPVTGLAFAKLSPKWYCFLIATSTTLHRLLTTHSDDEMLTVAELATSSKSCVLHATYGSNGESIGALSVLHAPLTGIPIGFTWHTATGIWHSRFRTASELPSCNSESNEKTYYQGGSTAVLTQTFIPWTSLIGHLTSEVVGRTLIENVTSLCFHIAIRIGDTVRIYNIPLGLPWPWEAEKGPIAAERIVFDSSKRMPNIRLFGLTRDATTGLLFIFGGKHLWEIRSPPEENIKKQWRWFLLSSMYYASKCKEPIDLEMDEVSHETSTSSFSISYNLVDRLFHASAKLSRHDNTVHHHILLLWGKYRIESGELNSGIAILRQSHYVSLALRIIYNLMNESPVDSQPSKFAKISFGETVLENYLIARSFSETATSNRMNDLSLVWRAACIGIRRCQESDTLKHEKGYQKSDYKAHVDLNTVRHILIGCVNRSSEMHEEFTAHVDSDFALSVRLLMCMSCEKTDHSVEAVASYDAKQNTVMTVTRLLSQALSRRQSSEGVQLLLELVNEFALYCRLEAYRLFPKCVSAALVHATHPIGSLFPLISRLLRIRWTVTSTSVLEKMEKSSNQGLWNTLREILEAPLDSNEMMIRGATHIKAKILDAFESKDAIQDLSKSKNDDARQAQSTLWTKRLILWEPLQARKNAERRSEWRFLVALFTTWGYFDDAFQVIQSNAETSEVMLQQTIDVLKQLPETLSLDKRRNFWKEECTKVGRSLTSDEILHIVSQSHNIIRVGDFIASTSSNVNVEEMRQIIECSIDESSQRMEELFREQHLLNASMKNMHRAITALECCEISFLPDQKCQFCGLALGSMPFLIVAFCSHAYHCHCALETLHHAQLKWPEVCHELLLLGDASKDFKSMEDVLQSSCLLCGELAILQVDRPFPSNKNTW